MPLVIFDEIHSYDAAMWQSLVDFLHAFDVPVLCMTATLPPTRREQLDGLLRAYPTRANERAWRIAAAAGAAPAVLHRAGRRRDRRVRSRGRCVPRR
jgi:hypothetical protein